MHDLAEVLVPIAMFSIVAAIILVPVVMRSHERRAAISAIKLMGEKGQPTPPELVTVLQQTHRPRTPGGNLKFGFILLAVAAAMNVLALTKYAFSADPMPHLNGSLIGASAFPGLIGLVLIGYWAFNRKTKLDD